MARSRQHSPDLDTPWTETTPFLPQLGAENSVAQQQLAEAEDGCGALDCLAAPFRAIGDVFSWMFGAGEDEEAEAEADPYERRLRDNDFRVGAGLDAYSSAFHSNFGQSLANLGPNSRWLDGGSGNAQAMQDLVARRGGPGSGNLPQMIATAYERPTGDRAGTLNTFEQQMANQSPGHFQYNSGSFFGDLTNEDLGVNPDNPDTLMDLITDQSGVMLYTHTLSQDLQRYLDLLKVGGEIYTSNFGSLSIDGQQHGPQDVISGWLGGVEGLEMSRGDRGGDGAYRLRKLAEGVQIPQLQRTGGNDSTFPPSRAFTRL